MRDVQARLRLAVSVQHVLRHWQATAAVHCRHVLERVAVLLLHEARLLLAVLAHLWVAVETLRTVAKSVRPLALGAPEKKVREISEPFP